VNNGLQNVFMIPELRRKILFTVFILIIYRVGGHIPVPGIDTAALSSFIDQAG